MADDQSKKDKKEKKDKSGSKASAAHDPLGDNPKVTPKKSFMDGIKGVFTGKESKGSKSGNPDSPHKSGPIATSTSREGTAPSSPRGAAGSTPDGAPVPSASSGSLNNPAAGAAPSSASTATSPTPTEGDAGKKHKHKHHHHEGEEAAKAPESQVVKLPIKISTEMAKEFLHDAPMYTPGPVKESKPGETLVAQYLYQATSIGPLLACIFFAWVFGWLGWSVLWLILIGIAVWKARQHEMEKGWRIFYRNAERRRKHQIAKHSEEHMEWFNIMLTKLWPTISESASQMAKEQTAAAIAQHFKQNKPPKVDDVIIDRITIGQIPFEIVAMKGFNQATELPVEDAAIVDVGKTAQETEPIDQATVFQLDCSVNYEGDFELEATAKLSLMKLSVPIAVRDVQFSGKMRIHFHFIPVMPYCSKLVFSFKTAPRVKFSVKTLGMDVVGLPSFEPMIQSTIDSVMLGMLVLPHRMTISLLQKSDAERVKAMRDEALRSMSKRERLKDVARVQTGILHIDLIEGRKLKAMDSNGLSDPFVKIKYGELKKKSEIIQRTITPKWNQAFEFPVYSNDVRELLIGCFDYDQMSGDDIIAEIKYDFSELKEEETKDVWLNLGKNNGELHMRFTIYPETKKKK